MAYYVEKIEMNEGHKDSYHCIDIKYLYIDFKNGKGLQAYSKASIYDYLSNHPQSIKVFKSPFPYVVRALSSNGEKYVRSEPNDSENDNLLKLPRV